MAGGASSKAKGARGELELTKLLGAILGGSFIRAPHSGAFIGGKNFHRRNTLSEGQVRASKADVQPPDHLPRLVIEAKNYGDFPYHLLLRQAPLPQLDQWIEQTLEVADTDDATFVAFKIARRGWTIVFPESESALYSLGNHVRYEGKFGRWILTDLTSFLETNKEAVIQRAGPLRAV